MSINSDLVLGVKDFLDSGNRSFLGQLKNSDRQDIGAQAVVRYLMQIKHWPFTPDSDFADVLEHLFGAFPERSERAPSEYQATTKALISKAFDYECIEIVPEPAPPAEEKPKKKGRSKQTSEEGESGSKTFKSLNDMDTSGASDRLKQVIAIQRGEA